MNARRNERNMKLKLGRAVAAWLLVPLLVLIVLKTDCLPKVTHHSESERIWQQKQQQTEAAKLKAAYGMPKTTVNSDSVAEATPPSPASSDEIAGHGVDVDEIKDLKDENNFLAMNEEIDGSLRSSGSSWHMDIYAMEGDIRMHGKSATVYVVAASNDSYWTENGTVTIRPFTRKYEMSSTMQMVREVTIRPSASTDDTAPPLCTVMHDVPAVVFSTGPDRGNLFHGMGDLVVPLYLTAREYDGHVQLVVTDYQEKWISEYRHVLAALSVYPVIDFDADEAVRCFPSVRVGIETHGELTIDPAMSRKGYTMMDFLDFLRSAYSLKRAWATTANRSSGQRPRLLMILRRHSRALTNEAEAMAAATEVGFEVVAAGPEMVQDIAQFAEVVNTCDVIVGVHGAGLTNMVFLPHNGKLVQIVPWGGIKFICWHEFGRPSPDMGLRYVEYEVTAEETTLKELYPKDHAVFTDPISIHKQGFGIMFSIFLDGQNITLDINRFKGVMEEIYQSVNIT